MTDSLRNAQGWVPDTSTFGARLALVRQRMGWGNVKEAADACAIAVESWRRWEAGRTEPRSLVSACMKIAGVTGVDYRWLALGPDDRTTAAAEASASGTLRYHGLGERVVTVGMTERLTPNGKSAPNLRTRPIDRGRLATVGAR